MSMYDQDWQDPGDEFMMTAEEQAALNAAMRGGSGLDYGSGDVYGPPVPVTNPDQMLGRYLTEYNDLADQEQRLSARMRSGNESSYWTLKQQYDDVAKRKAALESKITALRQKPATQPRPTTIPRGNALYEYTPPGTPGTPGTVNKIFDFPATPSASDGVGWANLSQRQYEFDQKMAWDRALAEMKARQDQEQADRSLQGSLFGHLSNSFTQNLPRMGDPSQVYFAGAQPGGPLETLFRQGGSSYDPAQGKIQWQQYDPNALWRQTAGMVKR